jgi:Xaa-Pro dipeptidase
MELYKKRVKRVQDIMKHESYNYLLIGPFSSMYYFSGFNAFPDERLQLLVIPSDGRPAAVLPEMYLKVAGEMIGSEFNLSAWSDQDNPFQVAREQIIGENKLRIAVDDQLRADHLLGLVAVLPGAVFEPASLLTDRLRTCKDEYEIDLMHEAGKIADLVMAGVQEEIRPGISEKELALYIETEYKRLADTVSFNPIVASGPNAALPHHHPGDRILEKGDFVVVDCGAKYKGYCSDITRTFCLGKATEEMKKVYRAVQEANVKAFEALQKNRGLSGEGADAAARSVITEAGYGPLFTHRTGHGIGLEVHEAPYLVEGNGDPLQEGMTFTIEPGIYLPGKFGVRIEDVVAMTGQGPRRLTAFNRDLIVL